MGMGHHHYPCPGFLLRRHDRLTEAGRGQAERRFGIGFEHSHFGARDFPRALAGLCAQDVLSGDDCHSHVLLFNLADCHHGCAGSTISRAATRYDYRTTHLACSPGAPHRLLSNRVGLYSGLTSRLALPASGHLRLDYSWMGRTLARLADTASGLCADAFSCPGLRPSRHPLQFRRFLF